MKQILTLLLLALTLQSFSQQALREELKKYNTESIPYIGVTRTSVMQPSRSYILDARELKEYKVSHIKNAIHVGYDNFDLEATKKQLTNQNAIIIVYCTLGVRSEDIAEKLKAAGYPNVFNLMGGIVQWKNEGKPVFDSKGRETDKVHVVSEEWGKWLTKGRKVY